MSELVKYPPMLIIGIAALVVFVFFVLFFLQSGMFCTICKLTGIGFRGALNLVGGTLLGIDITSTLTEIGIQKFCEVSTGGCRF